jgi:hypothetical protein
MAEEMSGLGAATRLQQRPLERSARPPSRSSSSTGAVHHAPCFAETSRSSPRDFGQHRWRFPLYVSSYGALVSEYSSMASAVAINSSLATSNSLLVSPDKVKACVARARAAAECAATSAAGSSAVVYVHTGVAELYPEPSSSAICSLNTLHQSARACAVSAGNTMKTGRETAVLGVPTLGQLVVACYVHSTSNSRCD